MFLTPPYWAQLCSWRFFWWFDLYEVGDRGTRKNQSGLFAQSKLSNLKDVKVFASVGHGIETYAEAMKYIGDTIKRDALSS